MPSRNIVRSGSRAASTVASAVGASMVSPDRIRQLINLFTPPKRTAPRSNSDRPKKRARLSPRARQGFTQVGGYTASKSRKKCKLTSGQPLKLRKKFVKNVQKVINHTKNYGEYNTISDIQVRQIVRDQYHYVGSDNNLIPLLHWSPRSIWDAASVLFHGKAIAFNGQNLPTDMLPVPSKFTIINSYVTYFFKSTSNHVVNIEMLICRPKNYRTAETIIQQINDSTDDVRNISTSWLYQRPGFKLSACETLHRNWTVEVRKMKFLPGASATQFIQGPKNQVFDGSKLVADGLNITTTASMTPTCRGSVYVTFRVINDITVNGVTDGPAWETVSAWPSSAVGGVAVRQQVCTKFAAPDATNNAQIGNVQAYGRFIASNLKDTDQQVVYENPINLGTPI